MIPVDSSKESRMLSPQVEIIEAGVAATRPIPPAAVEPGTITSNGNTNGGKWDTVVY